jgi:hypothetical protein
MICESLHIAEHMHYQAQAVGTAATYNAVRQGNSSQAIPNMLESLRMVARVLWRSFSSKCGMNEAS